MTYQLFLVKTAGADSPIFFEIRTFNNFNIEKTTPVSNTPVPEQDSSGTILIKLEGNTTRIGVDWLLLNEASGSVGTGLAYTTVSGISKWRVSGVYDQFNTVLDQVVLLNDYLTTISSTDSFDLYLLDSEVGGTYNNNHIWKKTGLLESVNITASSSSPVNWIASIKFIEGTTLQGTPINLPLAPYIISGNINGAHTIFNITYKENPLSGAGVDRPLVAGVQLIYKLSTSALAYKEINVVLTQTAPYTYSTNFPIGSVLANGTYDLKLALSSSASSFSSTVKGQPSAVLKLVVV